MPSGRSAGSVMRVPAASVGPAPRAVNPGPGASAERNSLCRLWGERGGGGLTRTQLAPTTGALHLFGANSFFQAVRSSGGVRCLVQGVGDDVPSRRCGWATCSPPGAARTGALLMASVGRRILPPGGRGEAHMSTVPPGTSGMSASSASPARPTVHLDRWGLPATSTSAEAVALVGAAQDQDVDAARATLARALELDSGFALAHAALVTRLWFVGPTGWACGDQRRSPRPNRQDARRDATKVVRRLTQLSGGPAAEPLPPRPRPPAD